MNEVKLSYVTIKYQAPIVYFVYEENTELGFPEIRELIFYAEKLSGQKPYFTFSDVRVTINVTTEGKRFLADQNNMPLFRGAAARVKNNMYKFAANFISNFSKQKYPFRAFTEEKHAIEWLLSLPLQ